MTRSEASRTVRERFFHFSRSCCCCSTALVCLSLFAGDFCHFRQFITLRSQWGQQNIDRAHEVGGPVWHYTERYRHQLHAFINRNKSFTHSFHMDADDARFHSIAADGATIRNKFLFGSERLKEKCISKWINKLNILYMDIVGHRSLTLLFV